MGNDKSEKVLQIEWSEMKENLSELAALRDLQSQRDVQRENLAARLTNVLQARNKHRDEEDRLTALKAHCLDRREYLQKLKSAVNQEHKILTVDTREIGTFLEALKSGPHCIAQATQRLQDAERLLSGPPGKGEEAVVLRHLLWRRQRLASQLAAIYPITKVSSDTDPQTEINRRGTSPCVDSAEIGVQSTFRLAISGNSIPTPEQKLMEDLAMKQDQPSLAVALGYIAQVVSLLAKYFGVHLLYPLHVAASRSIVIDPQYLHLESGNGRAPTAWEGGSSRSKWPLYAEGREISAVISGVNLLNKDIYQLLSVIGGEDQSGPKDVLHNLLHLLTGIQKCKPG